MNVFVFKNRFEADIVAGRKPHTIRGHRRDGKPRAKVGETISLRVWTGKPYRSKQREIARGVVTEVTNVTIEEWGIEIGTALYFGFGVAIRKLARDDGFKTWREMKAWFKAQHGLPFEGVLVKWRLIQ